METNSNNENTKSKIEQIRIDLEKKLAALEKAKLNVESNDEKTSMEKVEEVTNDIQEEIVEVKEQIKDNKSFIEQITDIEKSTETIGNTNKSKIEEKKEVETATTSFVNKIDSVEGNDSLFEIVDTIEQVKSDNESEKIEKEIIKKEIIKPINKIVEDKPLSTIIPVSNKVKKEEVKQSEKKKVVVPPTIISPKIEITENKIKQEDVEEEEKKSGGLKLNFLIYGLSAVLFLALVYFAWDYLSDKNNLEKKQTDQLISEYENRRYLDSIEIADANNQLLDIQNQRFLDSMALVNQLQVGNSDVATKYNAKKNNSPTSKSNVANSVKKRKKPTVTTEDVTSFGRQREVDNKSISNSNETLNNITPKNTTTNKIDKPLSNVGEEKSVNKTESKPNEVVNNENEVVKPVKPKVQTLSTIEVSPVYPGCRGTESQKKKCLMTKISKFVAKNFDAELANDLGLKEGRKRINVSFLIDKNGVPTVLKVRAQHEKLKKEALRVVSLLPKMSPGKVNGKIEPVLYNLPIVYDVEN